MSTEAALVTGQLLLEAEEAAQALESFRMAARAGDARGLTMLGRAAERGWGMAADARQAAAWYRRAADLGEPWAMFNLADLHLRGEGVPHDPAESARLYAGAARRGLLQALNMLGMLAESDAGRSDEAQTWFSAAAEGGDPWGQFNLARHLLARGLTVEALDWLDRALACTISGFHAAVADALERADAPELRRRAALARAMAEASAAAPAILPATVDQPAAALPFPSEPTSPSDDPNRRRAFPPCRRPGPCAGDGWRAAP